MRTLRYTVYYPDDAARPARCNVVVPARMLTLDRLRPAIEPHFNNRRVVRVRIVLGGAPREMLVDEIAALKGQPFNARATKLYRADWLARHRDAVAEQLPAIYGIAVLLAEGFLLVP